MLPLSNSVNRKSPVAAPRKEPSIRDDVDQRQVIVTFIVDPRAWNRGRIQYRCSLCGSTDNAGPTSNAAVHNEMREHLKESHRLKGTSSLRSEINFTDRGAISSVDFFHS
jgi:hypothetical protein